MDKISIIVPCYNEQAAIPFFYKEIDRVFMTQSKRRRLSCPRRSWRYFL